MTRKFRALATSAGLRQSAFLVFRSIAVMYAFWPYEELA